MRRLAGPIAAALVALWLAATPAIAAFPGANGRLAFDGSPGDGSSREIYTMNPDGSDVRRLTTDAVYDTLPAWSPDGRRIAFARGTFSNTDIFVMNADGSGLTQLTSGSSYDAHPAWSPDGTKIAFTSCRGIAACDVYTMNADGSEPANLTADNPRDDYSPAWSPDGSEIAYSRFTQGLTYPAYNSYGAGDVLYAMDPDGSGKTPIQNAYHGECEFFVSTTQADWSPNGSRIGYLDSSDNDGDLCLGIETVRRDWTGRVFISGDLYANSPAWSPDGTRLAYGFQVYNDFDEWEAHIGIKSFSGASFVDLLSDVSAANPDWQPLPARGYVRPQGATPVKLSLVPAFQQCTSPNREHGSPLAFGSCGPPVQSSSYLTIGTGPVNDEPAQSTGYARLGVQVGDPATPADEADVVLRVNVTDVRLTSDASDYTGELLATPRLRITDKLNTPHPGGPGPGTLTDFDLSFPVPCTATPEDGIGATCATTTTADTLAPGAVPEGRRSVWGLQDFEVSDGGPQASPADRVFLVPGVFVP